LSRARQTFDALERGLERLAADHPRLALSAAGAFGSLRNRLSRRWPSPAQIQALFPHLAAGEASRVAWAIGATEARNRLLTERIRTSGLAPVRPLVRAPAVFADLRPPMILGFFHVGPVQALTAAVERLPGPVLILRLGLLSLPEPPVAVLSIEGDGQRRAAALRRAIAHLSAGGFVVLAFDAAPVPGLGATCLGHTLDVARGPLALARLTGAPLRPMVARWRRNWVEIEVGEELAAAKEEILESALAAAAARWLERYLLDSPGELGLGLLRALLGLTPRAGQG
jgi:hypothetical protein